MEAHFRDLPSSHGYTIPEQTKDECGIFQNQHRYSLPISLQYFQQTSDYLGNIFLPSCPILTQCFVQAKLLSDIVLSNPHSQKLEQVVL